MELRKSALEGLEMKKNRGPSPSFWRGRKVLVTGHTGFKGGWLTLWLSQLGAKVSGFSLEPPTQPSFFELIELESVMSRSIIGDIRDSAALEKVFREETPEIVFHLAAQPLVRASYSIPIETFEVNALGTAKVLEAIRFSESVKTAVAITTDKCYENKEINYSYVETDRLGGHDPYSNSKAQAELVINCYQQSYFLPAGKIGLASARAGNVIGGGDFAQDRLVPDFIRAIEKKQQVDIRSPRAVRPWQHVLEPLKGYLLLAEHLDSESKKFSSAFNFGPDDSDCLPVRVIVDQMQDAFKERLKVQIEEKKDLHEATLLKLSSGRAKEQLDWFPTWNLKTALEKSIDWYELYLAKTPSEKLREISIQQVEQYSGVFR